jgi:hypothetical protein
MQEVLRSIPGLGLVFRVWASARAAVYRSEAELTEEAESRLPDAEELRTIDEIDVQVRTRASHPRLSELYSRQALASLHVELVDNAPPYDVVLLQRQLRDSEIPVVQLFSKKVVNRGDLGVNEHILYSARDDSAFEVLVEVGSDIGKIEQWVRDLDEELLAHLREVDNEVDEGFDSERYEHGERMSTSITAHLNRTSRTIAFERLLTRIEDEVDDVTVFFRNEPEWYLERVGGSSYSEETVMTVTHWIRYDDEWRNGGGSQEETFTDTESALSWLRDFLEDPPDRLDSR